MAWCRRSGAWSMEQLEVSHLFGMLVVMLAAAKVGGALAQRAGQPSVLGELLGGVIVGQSASEPDRHEV